MRYVLRYTVHTFLGCSFFLCMASAYGCQACKLNHLKKMTIVEKHEITTTQKTVITASLCMHA